MDAKTVEPMLDTIDEAAAVLHVSRGTVRNLKLAGHLRFVKVLGATRIPHEDVLRIVREGTHRS